MSTNTIDAVRTYPLASGQVRIRTLTVVDVPAHLTDRREIAAWIGHLTRDTLSEMSLAVAAAGRSDLDHYFAQVFDSEQESLMRTRKSQARATAQRAQEWLQQAMTGVEVERKYLADTQADPELAQQIPNREERLHRAERALAENIDRWNAAVRQAERLGVDISDLADDLAAFRPDHQPDLDDSPF